MPLALPPNLRTPLEPVFAALPFAAAMQRLTLDPTSPATSEPASARAAVERAAQDPELLHRPDLLAGLWLYIDELDRAHALAQSDHTPTGSFWHAVVHRREGDFDNARYWYRKTGHHPAMSHIDLTGGGAGSGTDVARYDPAGFVDHVERAALADHPTPHPALVSQQHKEWKALFEWCAAQTHA